jgi:tetratricopeptide (TPR) repeat protein
MRPLSLLGLLCLTISAFSQQTKTDSLINVLATSKEDTSRVKTLHSLFSKLEYENAAKAEEYLRSALTLSEKLNYKTGQILSYKYFGFLSEDRDNYKEAINNHSSSLRISIEVGDKKGELAAYNNIGIIYANQGNYPEALKNYLKAENLCKQSDNKSAFANVTNNIGNIYKYQGNYPEATKYYIKSLKLQEELGNTKGVSASYNNIGMISIAQQKFDEALLNYSAALRIAKENKDKKTIGASYNNIANVYSDKQNFTKALTYYDSCLEVYLEVDDKVGIAGAYNNIGNSYVRNGEYEKAIVNHLHCIEILKAIENNAGLSRVYSNIGDAYILQKKYDIAKKYLLESKALSTQIGNHDVLRDTYRALAVLYKDQNNYKEAYDNYNNYIAYRDSLNNEEADKKIVQSQMNFEFDKKEAIAKAEHQKELQNQQVLAEEKSRKQKIVISLVIAALVLAGIFTVFILRSLRITRKQKHLIERQKALVEKQKAEVEQQKHLVEEHQKEIIDSITYAKRIQRAILPSNEDIEKNLPNSFVLYKPKDIVAGDFYWMHHSAKDDLVLIAAADSTGHGVPGALVSVVCSNALNRAVDEFQLIEPGKILDKTRDLVLETFAKSGEEIKDGMDISMLSVNRKTKQIQWSGANNQLLYIPSLQGTEKVTELCEVKANKQPIGKTENPKSFTTHVFDMKEGAVFYLITDGYADQFGGEKGKKFKLKQLQEVLINTSTLTAKQQLDELTKTFDDWKGDLEQVDDVTIIGIRL